MNYLLSLVNEVCLTGDMHVDCFTARYMFSGSWVKKRSAIVFLALPEKRNRRMGRVLLLHARSLELQPFQGEDGQSRGQGRFLLC